MLKKSLIALAIAGTAFNAAADLSIDANGSGTGATAAQLISAEGVVNTASIALDDVTVVVDKATASYASADKIRVTITGGTLTPATNATFVWSVGALDLTATANSVTYPTTSQVVIDLAGAGETAVQGALDTNELTVGGLVITPDAKTAGSEIKYTVEILSSVGGSSIDSKSGLVATVVNQFSAKITDSFGDKDIDVGDDRLTFEGDVKTDDLTVQLASAAVDHAAADATAATPKYTVTGSFGFLDADGSGEVDTGTVATTTTSPTVAADFSSIEETAAALAGTFDGSAATTKDETFTITVDGEEHVLVPQEFTVDVEYTYKDDANKDGEYTATLSGGAWELNGANVEIPFLPFGSAYSQSVTVTNTGSVPGAVTADFTFNGETNTVSLGMDAAAKTVTDISAALRAKAAELGINGNARVNVVVNSPSNDIAVKAVYYSKADKDRVLVN